MLQFDNVIRKQKLVKIVTILLVLALWNTENSSPISIEASIRGLSEKAKRR